MKRNLKIKVTTAQAHQIEKAKALSRVADIVVSQAIKAAMASHKESLLSVNQIMDNFWDEIKAMHDLPADYPMQIEEIDGQWYVIDDDDSATPTLNLGELLGASAIN